MNTNSQQRVLSKCKTEKAFDQNTTSEKELKEQKQIENVIEENIEINQLQNLAEKQKKKTISQKELRLKQNFRNGQELNHRTEEEFQIVQEASHKNTQKKGYLVNKEKMAFQNNVWQKIQEMDIQLKNQQQEIGILKQNQQKEILPNSIQELLNELIQIQIKDFNRNYQQKIESQINEVLSRVSLEQKQNQKCVEQLKQCIKFDSENKNSIEYILQDFKHAKMEYEQFKKSLIELTSKLNQITQIQEQIQKDLAKLQQIQGTNLRQPQMKQGQVCQITQEQINQLNCIIEENARNIKIYVDDSLKNLQKKIQQNGQSEICKIKGELIQEQQKNFQQVMGLINTINQQKQLETQQVKEQQIQKQQFQQNPYLQNNYVQINNTFNQDQNNEFKNKKSIKILCIDDIINVQFDSARSQLIKKYINQLYDESSRKRDTEKQFQYYLRKIQSEKEMFEYYFIHNAQIQMELRKHCSQFRQVRGDGNCFYSAFGFQYLELLIRFSDSEFLNFKNQIFGKFTSKITYQNFTTDNIPNFSNYLTFEFIYRIQQLRKISDLAERQIQLEQQFAAHSQETEEIDGCFYGLVIIFFRNLSNYLFENSEMYLVITQNNNILIWEQEFNSTELIISELAKFLKIEVVLIFFEKNCFKVQEYQPKNQDKIILLIRPGHYNIGIK